MSESAQDWFQRAYQAQMSGRLDEAIECYRKSIELEPTAEAHTFLGWTYSFKRDYERAIAECKRAIEVDPDFGNPYNDIGAYLIETGRWDDAIPWLEKAIEAPRYEPRQFPHFNLSRIYSKRYEYAKAIGHLRKALEVEPRYPMARRELGKLLAWMN
jgi:tetratricopeptide (TPR) repeat protein